MVLEDPQSSANYVLNEVGHPMVPVSYEDPKAFKVGHRPIEQTKIRSATLTPQATEEYMIEKGHCILTSAFISLILYKVVGV